MGRSIGVFRLLERGARGPLLAAVLAMLVAVPGIGIPSKWSDEAATTTASTRGLGDLWRMLQQIDVVHGGYYLAMHYWAGLFGTSAVALRVPSLLAIGVAAAGVAVLARRLGGVPLLVTASIAFAVLPRVTWLAIEARSFAATVAIAAWATVLLLRVLQTGRMRWWVLYAALAAVGIVLNLYLALLLIAHAGTVLWSWRRTERPVRALLGLVGAGVVAVGASAPVLLLAAGQSAQIALSPLSLRYLSVMFGIEQFFTGATPVRSRLVDLPPEAPWEVGAVVLAVLGWALIVLGGIGWRRVASAETSPGEAASAAVSSERGRHSSLAAVAVPWIVGPALVLIGYSAVAGNLYTARYLSFTVPAAALLMGAGLLVLRPTPVRVVAVALVVAAAAPVYLYQRIPTGKQGTDWSSAAAIVDANKSAGDGLYWGQQYGGLPSQNDARIGAAYPDEFAGLTAVTQFGTGAEYASLWGAYAGLEANQLDGYDRVWVIGDHLGAAHKHPRRGADVLEASGFRLERSWNGVATDVFLWVRG